MVDQPTAAGAAKPPAPAGQAPAGQPQDQGSQGGAAAAPAGQQSAASMKAAEASKAEPAPETTQEKARRLAWGNPLEFEKAMMGGTETERKALTDAKAEYDAQFGPREPFTFSGRPGQAFSIDGAGFGTTGRLTLNGEPVPTTRWNDRSIKGVLPATAQPGDVVITPDGRGVINGTFGRAPATTQAATQQAPQAGAPTAGTSAARATASQNAQQVPGSQGPNTPNTSAANLNLPKK